MHTDDSSSASQGEILVVEDNTANLQFLVEILTQAGYRVRPAADGELALKSLALKSPDLILLDLMLPGIDGIEVCRRLKADPATKDIPVIFISSAQETELKVKALEIGGVDYVTKPISPPEVITRIHVHITLHRLRIQMEKQSRELISESEARLKERQLLFANFLNRISESILSNDDPDTLLEETNRIIGNSLGVDRMLIYRVSFTGNRIEGLCEWIGQDHPDIEATKGRYTSLDMFRKALTSIRDTRNHIESHAHEVNDCFIADGADGILHGQLHIRSLIWYPFAFDENGFYLFTLNQILRQRTWEADEIDFLKLVSKQVSIALMKIRFMEDLKQSRQALKENEERLRVAGRASYDLIYEWDVTNDTLEWFGDIDGLLGYPSGYVSNTIDDWLHLIHPDDRKNLTSAIQAHRTDISPIRYEYRLKHQNGTYRHFQDHGLPMLDREGRPYKWIGACSDITERKLAELELRNSEAKYKKLVNIVPYGIQLTDLEGRILFSNPAHHRIQGYGDGELIGKYIWDLMADDHHRERAKDQYRRIIQEQPFPRVYFNKDKNRMGKEIDVQINWDYVFDAQGKLEGIISIISDITEHKMLENRLHQAQKMEAIGVLSGGIAHDFNNILFPIIGHTEMLLEDAPDDSPFRDSLQEIHAGAMRAKELVHQILTFSRQGKTELRLMKMQPVIKEALKLIRSTIPSTITIHQDIHPGCGPVNADPIQVHQIIMNLTTNAYHAMEKTGGDLKVTLRPINLHPTAVLDPETVPGQYACLSVIDTGEGMDDITMSRIFDPFFTTKQEGKGTGMGLSVVHGIVKSMGGFIQVFSKPGQGSEFKVYLPIDRQGREKNLTHEPEPIPGGVETILLVDDEKPILFMEKQMLERLGYTVSVCSDSFEAIDTFRSDPWKYDLVITDMNMPRISGDQLSVELIRIRPDIPVLICTGFSEHLTEERIESLGISGFLMKPVVFKELAAQLRNILDKNGSRK